jgi:hypothetical protein
MNDSITSSLLADGDPAMHAGPASNAQMPALATRKTKVATSHLQAGRRFVTVMGR